MDRQRLVRILVVATALSGLALPRDLPAQIVQKATYVDEGSFTLPPQGSRAPESPRALAPSPVDGSLHVAGQPGRVFVYDAAGTFVRAYGQQQLEDPFAVVVDDEGRSYVLEGESNQVWTFGPDGEVLGAFGGRGDDLERLDDPRDLDVGPSGYVYVLDAGRRGVQIYSRDGVFIRRVSLGEVVGSPWGVAVARDGTIYVADEDVATHVLEYAPFTERTWETAAPTGPSGRVSFRGAQLERGRRLAVTAAGRILLVDEEQGRLWTRNPATDETVGANDLLYGGEGSGRGSFQRAVDIALAGDDAVLILDGELRKVEKVRIAFEEDGGPLPAFGYPFRVTRGPDVLPVPLRAIRHPEGADPLFVLRPRQTAVRVLPTRPQRFTTVYGDDARFFVPVEEEGQLFAQSLNEASAASLNDSLLVVSDPGEDRFAVYSRSDGSLIGTFGDNYEDQRSLDDPEGIVVLDDGRIAIADRGNDRVVVFSPDLATLLGSYPLSEAYGLAASPRGDLAAWNEEGRIVLRIAADGAGRQRVPSNLLPEQVSGLAFDHLGNLFVLDRESGRVTVLDPAIERVLTRIGSGGRMEEPRGVAADREGNVYVTDESDPGRTHVFRWDVHAPELTGVAFDYSEEPRLEWNPGPRRFIRGYQVQAASSSDGPYRVLTTTQDSALVLAADSAGDAAAVPDGARYVRVAPVIVNGVVGDPTPSVPIVDYTAISAYEAEDWERALEDASEAVDLVESGALEVPEEFRGLLPWIAFEAAYRTGAYGRAVESIDDLSTDDLTRHSLESRYHQLVPRAYQQAGENQRALDAAREALDRIEEGSLELDDSTRRDLMWVAFTGAFEQENYRAVVGWGERLRESVSSARRVEFFSRLPRAQLFLGVPDSAAITLLSIGGQDPRAEYYQDSTVVDLSFDIYRELLTLNRPPAWAAPGQAAGGGPGGPGDAGGGGETATENAGLQFLREYVRSIPGSAQGLRSAYQDSLTVFTTRADLDDAIESWRNADYAQVVRTLQAVLESEDLPVETEVVGRQLLAAAFFTFGRQEDAADAFEGLLDVRSDVSLEEESERLERLYGLDVYSPDMIEYFRGLLPGSAGATDPDPAELAATRAPPGAPRPPDA